MKVVTLLLRLVVALLLPLPVISEACSPSDIAECFEQDHQKKVSYVQKYTKANEWQAKVDALVLTAPHCWFSAAC